MYVGGAQAELAGAGADLNAFGGVGFLELGGDFLGAVGGAVVDDDEFPVEVTIVIVLELGVVVERRGASYFSVNVLLSSHVIIGRFRRSL